MKKRTANHVLITIAVTTILFIVAQFISFIVTRQEQSTLIISYFGVVTGECVTLLVKRIFDKKNKKSEDNAE